MPGFVEPHLYGHIIDLWLNTFPHTQGQSSQEFESKGKPTIALNIGEDAEKHEDVKQYYIDYFNSAEVVKYRKLLNIDDKDIDWKGHSPMEFGVAGNLKAYIDKATLIIKNKDLAGKLGNLNKLFCFISTQGEASQDIISKFSSLTYD